MQNKPIDGFLNIYKPKGITSFDVCQKIRRIFNTKKVGHSGTLDPNATGVMQVAIGKATKLLPLLEDHTKVYEATIKFGILTDTLDPEGTVLKENKNVQIKLKDIDEAIFKLKTIETQVPPIYSAIKINGKKMYEYAREGKEIELKPRPIKIYESIRTSDFFEEDGFNCIKVKLKVSKGFYVRSYVRDLAQSLGTFAIMSDLVRLQIDAFTLENSKKIEELTANNIISIEETFKNFPRFNAKEYLVKLIKNGITLDERQIITDKPFLVYFEKKLIAVYAPVAKNKYKIVQYLGE